MAKFYVQNISSGESIHDDNFGYGLEIEADSFETAGSSYAANNEFDSDTDVLVAINVASFRKLPATVTLTFSAVTIADLDELE